MKTLVAGIGNVFFGDDAFGVEVAARLAQTHLGNDVRILDAGIRARYLAYELLDGSYDTAILLDAVARGGEPGTLYVIEPESASQGGHAGHHVVDAHAMNPEVVIDFVRKLGGVQTRILIVGCEPADVGEGMGLSKPVAAAVDEAVALVRDLVCA